ncbi:MAG: hypothetical protein WAR22_00960, partial [Desulfomonilia bacterium]
MVYPAVSIFITGKIEGVFVPGKRPPVLVFARKQARSGQWAARRPRTSIKPPFLHAAVNPHCRPSGDFRYLDRIFNERKDRSVDNEP